MEWGHICVPRKSDEDVECECFYVNCCVCCLPSPTAPGQGIPFSEVVICKRGAPGASSWTWHAHRFLAIRLRRRGGAPLVLPRGASGRRAPLGVAGWFRRSCVQVSLPRDMKPLLYRALSRSLSWHLNMLSSEKAAKLLLTTRKMGCI